MHPPTRMGRGPSRIQLKSEDVSRVKIPEDKDKDCVMISCPVVKLKDAKPREDTGLRLRSSSGEDYGTLDYHARQARPTLNMAPDHAHRNHQRDVTDIPNSDNGQAPRPRNQSRIHGDDLEAYIIDDESSGVLPEDTWILICAIVVLMLLLASLYFGLGIWAMVTSFFRVVKVVKGWASGDDVSRINGHD